MITLLNKLLWPRLLAFYRLSFKDMQHAQYLTLFSKVNDACMTDLERKTSNITSMQQAAKQACHVTHKHATLTETITTLIHCPDFSFLNGGPFLHIFKFYRQGTSFAHPHSKQDKIIGIAMGCYA